VGSKKKNYDSLWDGTAECEIGDQALKVVREEKVSYLEEKVN